MAPRKSDPKRALARAQAKLVYAAKAGTLRDWARARICDCLGAMGVKVPYNINRRQARDVAMQQALPLLAQMDSDWVPPTDRVTRSAAPPSSSQPCSQVPVDSLMNDTVGVAVVLCFCMLAVPIPIVPIFSFSADLFIH